jgi:hypothetical protein
LESEFPLHLDRPAGDLVRHGEILECLALGADVVVFLAAAGSVRDFEAEMLQLLESSRR